MDSQSYYDEFANQIDRIYHAYPTSKDHRIDHPWAVGAHGDPFAGIMFVAEFPSLRRVEQVRDPDSGPPTIEAQWWASPGDKLFRKKLVKHGFKSGTIDSPGGWRCYITNVIKEADYSLHWNAKTQTERNRIAEIWSPVLSWELSKSRPKLVVIMGNKVEKLLNHLSRKGHIILPRITKIQHYAYVALYPRGKLGPMHPLRVQEYDEEIANVAGLFRQLKK